MKLTFLHQFLAILLFGLLLSRSPSRGEEIPPVQFQAEPGRLTIRIGDRRFATYVFDDRRIPRPFFSHLHNPDGLQVTRNHPPVAGKDATDHDTFHPGLWLAFGELSGSDNWRNKAQVQHEKFMEEPTGQAGKGGFTSRNRYLDNDRKTLLCREVFRATMITRPSGWLLIWDSGFTPTEKELVFGDQEEMGLGVRMATPLAVKNGGRILNSAGNKNEVQAWGKQANWCDYSGKIGAKMAGVTLMPDPANFGQSWFHARDYGLLVANPFGRAAFTKGEKSKVIVKPGESLHLRFGILFHTGLSQDQLARAYQDFLKQLRTLSKEKTP